MVNIANFTCRESMLRLRETLVSVEEDRLEEDRLAGKKDFRLTN